MANTETIRTVVGIIDPYLATLLNCMMWVLFGLPFVHPNSMLVITINGTGLVIEAAYLIIFFTYAPSKKRKNLILVLLIELIFMAIVAFITLKFFHTHESRSMIVGILCCIFNVIMYASPLTVMSQVIRTRSVKYMPFLLTLANFANALVWSIYALLPVDPYILFPNGSGFLLAVAQLILYATYYKSTPKEDGNKGEVELSQTA
ncbi:SWEET sugar transporter [Dillenia turbinata]|uniref:SWEET sugar transporter n=1 Tax=Dillenia turbinata TaxID=194707 RepID=A0AAN8V4D3_9MAGN